MHIKYPVKMIVCDLDGTILHSDKSISDHTIVTLNHCRESGIKVIYATGRGGRETLVVPSDLFDAGVTHNGALAFIDDNNVYSSLIPKKFML